MTTAAVTASPARCTLCNTIAAGAVCVATALAVIALCSLGLLGIGFALWLGATVVFEAASLYVWSIPMDAPEWLAGTLLTPVLAALTFAITGLIARFTEHHGSFIQAALHGGPGYGIALSCALCPAGTILFLGGWIRAALRKRLLPASLPEN
jgi:hypothetical protein